MSRIPMIAGNWKLHYDGSETLLHCARLVDTGIDKLGVEIVVAPTFTSLHAAAAALRKSDIKLSAQNVDWADSGARTGEISPGMLLDVGCTYTIIGHSERRSLFGETDEGVKKKVAACLAKGLLPILCVGETLEQREAGQTEAIVLAQVRAGLAEVAVADLTKVVIAYEPVWAIGTGKVAAPEDAQAVHHAIRGAVSEINSESASKMRIIYGGSVKPANAASLLSQPDIDGALVGGASLKADSFFEIAKEGAKP